MTTIRVARAYTGRELVVKFSGCYHGHSDLMLIAAGSGPATLGSPDSAGVTKATAKRSLRPPSMISNLIVKSWQNGRSGRLRSRRTDCRELRHRRTATRIPRGYQ